MWKTKTERISVHAHPLRLSTVASKRMCGQEPASKFTSHSANEENWWKEKRLNCSDNLSPVTLHAFALCTHANTPEENLTSFQFSLAEIKCISFLSTLYYQFKHSMHLEMKKKNLTFLTTCWGNSGEDYIVEKHFLVSLPRSVFRYQVEIISIIIYFE